MYSMVIGEVASIYFFKKFFAMFKRQICFIQIKYYHVDLWHTNIVN